MCVGVCVRVRVRGDGGVLGVYRSPLFWPEVCLGLQSSITAQLNLSENHL